MPLRKACRNRVGTRRPLRRRQGVAYPFVIFSMTPTETLAGSGATPIDVNGIGFPLGAVVYVNGVAQATTYGGAGLLQFTMSALVVAVPGVKTIQVKYLDLSSNSFPYSIVLPVPTLGSVTPPVAYVGEGAAPAAIAGTGFYNGSTGALLDGAPIPFAFSSTTAGTATVPVLITNVAGDYQIAIINPAPGGGITAPLPYQVRYREPRILSLDPNAREIGRGGAVLINGDPGAAFGFYSVSIVTVDDVPVSSARISRTQMSFEFAPGTNLSAGTHTIVVSNPTEGGGGGVSNSATFTFLLPTLIALDITEVVQFFDGFPIRAQAENLDANIEITFNDVPQPTTVLDANNAIANVTSAACAVPGTTFVRLRDKISGISSNALTFTVYPWSPADIPASAGMRLWTDGSSLVDDGTGRASQWNDMSGGARHLAQATAGKRPLIVASIPAFNGKTGAYFDGTRNDRLVSALNWTSYVTATTHLLWAVVSATAIGAGRIFGDVNGDRWIGETLSTVPKYVRTRQYDGVYRDAECAFDWQTTFPPFFFRSRHDGGFLYTKVNRLPEASVVCGSVASSQLLAVGGAATTTTGSWRGYIVELLVFERDINPTYKALIENRLSYLYGLPFATPGQTPHITGVFPNSCTQLAPPFYFEVEDLAGGYTPQTTVNVGRVPLATTFLSATRVRARMPNDALAFAGGRAITVSDVGGISGPSGITVFPYVDQAGPNLYSLTPNTVVQHGDALVLHCYGNNFGGAVVTVAAGAFPCTGVIVHDAGHIECTVPAQALDVLPGRLVTITVDGVPSNPLELTLTPWSPLSIVGVTGWYSAESVVLGAGSDVAQVNDLSGYGNHYTQATVSKRPLLIASDARFNGKPTLDLDGVDDYMTGPTFTAAFANPSLGAHYGIAFRADAITGNGAASAPYNNNCVLGGASFLGGIALKNTPAALCYSTNGSGTYYAASTPVAINTTYWAYAAETTTLLTLTLNGAVGTTAGPGVGAFTGLYTMSIGSNGAFTSNFLNGAIAEWWTTNRPATAQDIICWRNYCRYKYGTP